MDNAERVAEEEITGDRDLDLALIENEVLRESYAAATQALLALQTEDEGWLPFGGVNKEHSSFTITHLHQIHGKARLQVAANPLLHRGLMLRTSYVWGRGIKFDGDIKPRHQKILDQNFNILFSQTAFAKLERTLYTAGNLFMAYKRSTGKVFQIPFHEISNFATDVEVTNEVTYYQRTYTPVDLVTGEPVKNPIIEWYPVFETSDTATSRNPVARIINGQRVNSDIVIIDVRVNHDADAIWGVPDVLPAMPYAWAHSEYLKDGSKLLKALSTIAWKVVSKSRGNAAAAGARMAEVRRAGGVANMTGDTDLVAMPKAGQVNLADGDRIASYVASALGVSLTALLSTAAAAGGSYGAEASLDTPQQNEALARQAVWRDGFYRRLLKAMGLPDEIEVIFRSIVEDSAFRTAQTLTLAFQSGAIHQDEYRETFLDMADIEPMHDEGDLPKPSPFTGAKQTNVDEIAQGTLDLAKQQAADDAAIAKKNAANQVEIQKHQINTNAKLQQQGVGSTVPSKGNSGAAGSMNRGNNDLRDAERKPGTAGK